MKFDLPAPCREPAVARLRTTAPRAPRGHRAVDRGRLVLLLVDQDLAPELGKFGWKITNC